MLSLSPAGSRTNGHLSSLCIAGFHGRQQHLEATGRACLAVVAGEADRWMVSTHRQTLKACSAESPVPARVFVYLEPAHEGP